VAELLKDVYSKAFIDSVAEHFQKAYPDFEKQRFVATIFDDRWGTRELKSRLTFITHTLYKSLPIDF
jgi:hypothetical protein